MCVEFLMLWFPSKHGHQVNSPVSVVDKDADFNMEFVPRRCMMAVHCPLRTGYMEHVVHRMIFDENKDSYTYIKMNRFFS